MTDIGMSVGSDGSRYKRWLGAALVGAAAFVAWQLTGTGRLGPASNSTNAQAVSEHCKQFVAIAKANFGANWKPRLDPRDPLCANEIQQAWERQSVPRNTSVAPLTVEPSRTEPAAPPKPPESAGPAQRATVQAETSAQVETYCLNILGLARTNFGDEWRANVTPQEAANCRAFMQ